MEAQQRFHLINQMLKAELPSPIKVEIPLEVSTYRDTLKAAEKSPNACQLSPYDVLRGPSDSETEIDVEGLTESIPSLSDINVEGLSESNPSLSDIDLQDLFMPSNQQQSQAKPDSPPQPTSETGSPTGLLAEASTQSQMWDSPTELLAEASSHSAPQPTAETDSPTKLLVGASTHSAPQPMSECDAFQQTLDDSILCCSLDSDHLMIDLSLDTSHLDQGQCPSLFIDKCPQIYCVARVNSSMGIQYRPHPPPDVRAYHMMTYY